MIKICDAIMGSGKTSAAITYMNEHCRDKFIFVTPYLDEADRIKKACPGLNFVEPSNKLPSFGFKKVTHTEYLISEGFNITTTHQAFKNYTPAMLDMIKEQGYTLFIDECLDIVEPYSIHKDDLEIAVDAGVVKIINGEYVLANKDYNGFYFHELVRLMQSRNLVRNDGEGEADTMYWTLPPSLLKSFKYVFVLTYLFEGQSLCYYMRAYNLPYEYIGVEKSRSGRYHFGDYMAQAPSYVSTLKDKIHILDNKKLNDIGNDFHALSVNWFKERGDCEQLKKNIVNYFINIMKDVSADGRLWTTFKDSKGKLSGKGYTKAFLPFNMRASNSYRSKNCLVYAVNIFIPTGLKMLFRQRGIGVDENLYALSNMVQWIWRSAIRDGNDIYIYIPSRRMRKLLETWIDDVGRRCENGEKKM